ncbi:hypothetical protein MY5147_004193 [Beauveria neobassiana]
MKVSTTSFLLASLYGSALAAPVGDDLGGALEILTNTAGLGNVAPGNAVPGNAIPGNIAPVNDLTEGLTGAVGQPGNIVDRDGEQKASVVLPNYNFIATDHTADVNIKADATNVHARNLYAKVKGVDSVAQVEAPIFTQPPAVISIDANVALPTGNL